MARVSSRAAIASSMVLYLRFKMYLSFLSMRTNHLLFDAIHWMWWSRCGAPKFFLRASAEFESLSAIAFALLTVAASIYPLEPEAYRRCC